MKQSAFIAGAVLVAALGGYTVTRLSSDALGMAVGLLFGVLAAIPTALLVLARNRRRRERDYEDEDYLPPARPGVPGPYPYQPPVIVLAAPMDQQQPTTVNNTYHDNRQVHIHTQGSQGMPLVADRQREIQQRRAGRVFNVTEERDPLTPREQLPPLLPEQQFNWYGPDSEWGDIA